MPGKSKSLVPIEQIDGMIHTIRGVRVMRDRDLAQIYGVPTKAFNQAVKRNRHRFPTDFMFQLTTEEAAALNCDLKERPRPAQKVPTLRFTEHGALQAANVLRSPRAVQMSVYKGKSFSNFVAQCQSLRPS